MSEDVQAMRDANDAAVSRAARAQADRVRRLHDRGYRLRWSYGLALLVADIIFAPTIPIVAAGVYPDWLIYALGLLVLANLIGRLLAPPASAPPTSDRLAAERVLTISTRQPEAT